MRTTLKIRRQLANNCTFVLAILTLLTLRWPCTRTAPASTLRFERSVARNYEMLMIETLRTLVPQRAKFANTEFRHILIREHVGLKWNMYPEQYFSEYILPRLPKGMNIVDVGANVGQFTVAIAKGGHRAIAFEPNGDTCNKLKENIRPYNRENNVSVCRF